MVVHKGLGLLGQVALRGQGVLAEELGQVLALLARHLAEGEGTGEGGRVGGGLGACV